MNMRYYDECHSLNVTRLLYDDLGIDDKYRTERRHSFFTVEQHASYLNEMELGDELSVHARIIGRSDVAVHVMSFMLNRSRDRIASTVEHLWIHVDLDRRKAANILPDIAIKLDRHIEASKSMEWTAPVCGSIRISGERD